MDIFAIKEWACVWVIWQLWLQSVSNINDRTWRANSFSNDSIGDCYFFFFYRIEIYAGAVAAAAFATDADIATECMAKGWQLNNFNFERI